MPTQVFAPTLNRISEVAYISGSLDLFMSDIKSTKIKLHPCTASMLLGLDSSLQLLIASVLLGLNSPLQVKVYIN